MKFINFLYIMEKYIKEHRILFKKYKILEKLGEGPFGDIYKGKRIEDGELVTIKFGKKDDKNPETPSLFKEAHALCKLQGFGIPEVVSFGIIGNGYALVELLGKSLYDICKERNGKLHLDDCCLIGLQVLDRIKRVHSKKYIHRDIRPENFMIGRKDPYMIYITNFSFSKKYIYDQTNKHIIKKKTGKMFGTLLYSSADAQDGWEQSRKDDLISIGYMMLHLISGKLIWSELTNQQGIYKLKANLTPKELCEDCPSKMIDYFKYVKQLSFEEEPNYSYLKDIFRSMLTKSKLPEKLLFSWIDISVFSKLKVPINPTTRKSSPQERIYKKIKDNINNRNNSEEPQSYKQFQQVPTLNNINIIKNENEIKPLVSKYNKKEQKNVKKEKEVLEKKKNEKNVKILKKQNQDNKNIITNTKEKILKRKKEESKNQYYTIQTFEEKKYLKKNNNKEEISKNNFQNPNPSLKYQHLKINSNYNFPHNSGYNQNNINYFCQNYNFPPQNNIFSQNIYNNNFLTPENNNISTNYYIYNGNYRPNPYINYK